MSKLSKKISKSALKKKCDKLFSQIIRSKGFCEFKGKDKVKCSSVLNTMHIFSRTNLRLRWDENNVICGCAGHHRYYTTNNFEFIEAVMKWWPEKYRYIQKHKNETDQEPLEYYQRLRHQEEYEI